MNRINSWPSTIKSFWKIPYFMEYKCAHFFIENDAEIVPVHYTKKVAFTYLITRKY